LFVQEVITGGVFWLALMATLLPVDLLASILVESLLAD